MKAKQLLSPLLLMCLTTACGSAATPEPSTPKEPEAEKTAVPEEPETPIAEEPSAVEEPPSATVAAGPSSGRTPKDIVGAESVRFVLSFTNSEVGIKAGERCDQQHGADPQKRNECMKSARALVKEDVVQFEEGASGQWVWTTSQQRGSTLLPLKKTNFTWGKETKDSIELQPSKGDKVVVGVPSNYSIVIEHPQHGKLTYDSKTN